MIHEIVFTEDGEAQALYDDEIVQVLDAIGPATEFRRVGWVEPVLTDGCTSWDVEVAAEVRFGASSGRRWVGRWGTHAEALAAEVQAIRSLW